MQWQVQFNANPNCLAFSIINCLTFSIRRKTSNRSNAHKLQNFQRNKFWCGNRFWKNNRAGQYNFELASKWWAQKNIQPNQMTCNLSRGFRSILRSTHKPIILMESELQRWQSLCIGLMCISVLRHMFNSCLHLALMSIIEVLFISRIPPPVMMLHEIIIYVYEYRFCIWYHFILFRRSIWNHSILFNSRRISCTCNNGDSDIKEQQYKL